MKPFVIDGTREIVNDFAKAIQDRKDPGAKPSKTVINFRNDKREKIERDIFLVPLDLLRYRKDNGRIASDVTDYKKSHGPLDEKDAQTQKVLREFLEQKDPEKTDELSSSIRHGGQDQPAIITCDGFLINGNRRKMVMEKLNKLHPSEGYDVLKVVILPGANDPGGPPTLKEIEQLENRYQLQSEGKSEYYGFDRALSIKRKIDMGYSLEEQLRDDPQYAKVTAKELERAVKDYQKDYLLPLQCVDRYLHQFGREGLYSTVSAGRGDSEGRWQAFLDYSQVYQKISADKWQLANDFPQDEMGCLEDVAFKMIRLREIQGQGKLHAIMRQLPELCANKASRKELFKIGDKVENDLPDDETLDKDGNPLSIPAIDARWFNKNKEQIIWLTKKAREITDSGREKETPIELLEAALKKLTHENFDITKIRIDDLPKARQLASNIQRKAKEVEAEIFHSQKQWDKLPVRKK